MPPDLRRFLIANDVDTFTVKRDDTGVNVTCIPNTRRIRKLIKAREKKYD